MARRRPQAVPQADPAALAADPSMMGAGQGLDPTAILGGGDPAATGSPAMDVLGMGGGTGTDVLGDQDLSALAGAGADAGPTDDMQLEQLQSALGEQGLDPQARADLESRLALAARRRLAGQ